MKKKIGLFLFALGLSASYVYADDDTACIMDCHAKYVDCMSRGYFTPNYCQGRMSVCSAMCDGSYGGTGPIP